MRLCKSINLLFSAATLALTACASTTFSSTWKAPDAQPLDPWGIPYAPAQVTTETILRVETLVYSLDRDALLWAGTSRTVNPSKVSEVVAEVADRAAKEMMKQGLLPGAGARRVASAEERSKP
jgi:hypothetical protein